MVKVNGISKDWCQDPEFALALARDEAKNGAHVIVYDWDRNVIEEHNAELVREALTGKFVHENGAGWVGIAYVSDSIGKTVFIRPDTDLGVIDCQKMMECIERMSDEEKFALITR